MKWLAVFGLVLAGLPVAAQAQVVVNSGEHGGFTRLVARIGADREWTVTRDGRSVTVELTPIGPGFDLSQVFERIGRDRIAGIEGDAAGLRLTLACDCTVEPSRYQDRFLVIDVSDRPYLPPPARQEPAFTLPLFTDRAGAALPATEETASEPHTAPTAAPPDIEAAGDLLAEQLARAAAAGLLDAIPVHPDNAPEHRDASPESDHSELQQPSAHGETLPDDISEEPEPSLPPIIATTAFDLNAGSLSGGLSLSGPSGCMAMPARPLSQWPGDASFLTALGELRSLLYDDRGQLQSDQALAMAELYLVNGFGAEAAFWLSELEDPPAFQTALARFLEDATPGVFGAFTDAESCDPGLMLWLFLASDPPPRLTDESRTQILASYFALAATLRDLLGPSLARALHAAGEDGAALEVREALARGGRLPGQEMAFLDQELTGHAGDDRSAIHPANAGSVRTAEALGLRMMITIEATGRADAGDLVAAEALIRETEPPLIDGGLRHVSALAHALGGDVRASLDLLGIHHPQDAEALPIVFTSIVSALIAQERTAPLLVLITSDQFGQFGPYPTPAARRQVADYLLTHGMPELARDIVLAGGNDHARDRELLTRAFDRMAADIAPPEALPPVPEQPLPPIPQTPEAIAELLDTTRDFTQEARALLAGESPALTH
jgi:hypothetical protein